MSSFLEDVYLINYLLKGGHWGMKAALQRRKISTTVSPQTHRYLGQLVKSGRAATLAEAVDLLAARAQQAEQRIRLEQDTAAYFARLPRRAQTEEARLEAALASSVDEVNFED